MAYSIKIDGKAIKDLGSIDKTTAAKILYSVTDKLAKRPEDFPFLRGQLKGYRKFRVGDYRVIYKIEESDVSFFESATGKKFTINYNFV